MFILLQTLLLVSESIRLLFEYYFFQTLDIKTLLSQLKYLVSIMYVNSKYYFNQQASTFIGDIIS